MIKKYFYTKHSGLFGVLLFFYTYTNAQDKLYSGSAIKMGTEFNIKISAKIKDSVLVQTTLTKAWKRIDDINLLFSDYIQESELAILHKNAGQWTKASEEFISLTQLSIDLSYKTEGAFDISIGTLTRLWRRAIKMSEFPAAEKINVALANSGYKKIKISGDSIYLPNGMLLDFGAIAKGYAIDQAYSILKKHNFKRALVDGGGDLYIGKKPHKQKGWQIWTTIKQNEEWIDKMILLSNCGIATSGDKYKYIEDPAGNRYAHIINPTTGMGIKGPILCTVLAKNATLADSWATALSVSPELKSKNVKRLN